MKVLWISPKLPYPPESGDKLRQYNLIRILSSDVEISLVAFTLTPEEDNYAGHMAQYCSSTKTFFSENPSNTERIKYILRLRLPYYVSRYQNADAIAYIDGEIKRFQPDVLQIEHTYMAEYLRNIAPQFRPPSVLTKHNIDSDLACQSYLLAKSSVSRFFWWLEWKKMRVYEPHMDHLFSAVVTMSDSDRSVVLQRKHPPSFVEVVENGVDTSKFAPLPPGYDPVLLFIGALDYLPNQDAALYLCAQILPLIRKTIPGVKVLLVGRKPSQEILNLSSEVVEVWGDVPDVEPYYTRASVAVVPLRAGSGSRLKILEAMALGRPVISTGKGAEGLDLEPGEDFLRGEDAASFSEAVVKLLNDPDLYRKIAARARRTVVEKYDWSKAAQKMQSIYRRVAGQRGRL